ncbi:MAG TPA: peptide ABC transporter substrate-binding protein [Candidatus Saccharimonadales bacterium]|nr:peptide ABC transporter substrate-binding protein [Candidatus Saccharimonadales bacterium]
MSSLKSKIISYFTRGYQVLSLFGIKRKGQISQSEIDKKLVYSLSPRKIPTGSQFKYLPKFLNPKEYLFIKIFGLLAIINIIYLGTVFVRGHLQYTPAYGGVYTEAIVGYPKTINPLYAASRDVDNDLSRLIYSSLFKYDTTGVIISDLATSYQVSDDGKEYTVVLQENAKWHTGEAVTADDVIFTLNLIKNENYRSSLRMELINVSAEKIDNKTVKFILPEAYAPFLEMLTFGVMPKSIWENISPDAASLTDLNLKPIGSGPYKFKSLIKSKSGDLKEYHLEANEDYYGQKPYIKNIIFKFFADYIEAIKSFDNNQLDGISYLPFDYRSELLVKDSVNMFELVRPQIVGIFFNQDKNKALADKDVRAALAKALDKEGLINDIFSGVYQLADSPILKNSPYYNNNVTRYNYSVEEAKAGLGDKLTKLVLTVIDLNSNVAVATKIQTDLAIVGVGVELKIIPLEQAATVIKNRDFEAILYGQAVGGDPDVFAFWHSTQIGSKGLNIAGYSNEEVDTLLIEARSNVSGADRNAKYQRFQEIVTSEIPVIFLYSPTYTYVQRKKIKGFNGQAIIEPADRFSQISDWYIKTHKKLTW